MIKSCLFLDFDNVFSGLKTQSALAANNFAEHPMDWLKWLENTDFDEYTSDKRTILVRKCYLNPTMYGKYRPFFVQSSFQVIDCPTLTSQGKNSADIYMVLDILTYLEHRTQFDEFIIMSADSDFTPILVRLRENNKKTIVVASGLSSIAYRNSSDLYLDQGGFIDVLESFTEVAPKITLPSDKHIAKGAKNATANGDIKAQIKNHIEALLREDSQLVLGSLAMQLKKKYHLPDDDWFGYKKFSDFVQTLDIENTSLDLTVPGYLIKETSILHEEVSPEYTDEIAQKLYELLGIPLLSITEYNTAFSAIAEFMQKNEYTLSECAKFIRNQAQKNKQEHLSRKICNYILFGIHRSGVKFAQRTSVEKYRSGFYDYIKMLIKANQIEFSTAEDAHLQSMLGLQ